MSIFKNKNFNEKVNEKNKDFLEEKCNENPNFFCPFKSTFKEALFNPNTFDKDILILDQYAIPFFNFFMHSNSNSLPMFTYPPEPKSVKRVTVDKTFTLNANTTGYIQIFPFSKNMMWSQNGTDYSALITNEALNCFVKYKVVCCKIMIKQIGIMHLTDGYGTAFDAVMTTSSSSFNYLKDNLLNVQAAPGRRVMLVDGRSGLEAFFLGSPLYHYNYNYSNIFEPTVISGDPSLESSDPMPVYIPANSTICPTTDNTIDLVLEDGTPYNPPYAPVTSYQKIISQKGGALAIQLPEGDSIFIRISPPTINVSIKLYIDFVVEGQVKDEYLSNMPQYLPPTPFDFTRIQFAFQNVVPSIRTKELISSCSLKLEKEIFDYPKKPIKHLPSIKGSKKFPKFIPLIICSEIELNIIPPHMFLKNIIEKGEKRKRINKIIENRIANIKYHSFLDLLKPICEKDLISTTDNLFLNEIRTKSNIRENLNYSFDLSYRQMFRNDSCNKDRELRLKEKHENLISYCSNRKIEVKKLTTIQKFANIVNPIELPEYIKNACLFTGEVVTMIKSSPNSNRLFRDSFTPLPANSYQYFPAITNEGDVYPALVCVKLGLTGKKKTSYAVPLSDSEKSGDLVISYDEDQFVDEKEFLNCLDTIIDFAYGKLYHYCPPDGLTIKFFGLGKFTDISYMLALTVAIFGAPSGGFYTGAFKNQEGNFLPIEMSKEALSAKLKIASSDYPLNVLAAELDDGTTINTISGGIPSYQDGKMMPSSDINVDTIYFMTPFSLRGYKKTPMFEKNADAKRFLSEQMSSYPIKYIIFSNVDSIQKFENLSKEIPYKYFSRANPDNFTCYALRNGRLCTANSFYEAYPELMTEGLKFWKFKYKDNLYVERNAFLSDLRKMKYGGGDKATRSNISKYEAENQKIKNINAEDVDQIKDYIWDELSKIPINENRRIDIDEVDKNNLARDLNEKDYTNLDPFRDMFLKGLRAINHLLTQNFTTGKDSKSSVEKEDLKTLFGVLKFPQTINKKCDLKNSNEWKYFKIILDEIGTGGIIAGANIFGWVDKPQTKYKASTLKKLLEGFKRLSKKRMPKIPEIEEDEKSDEVEERQKNIKKKIKRSNYGKERSEMYDSQSESEEEKEEKPKSKKKVKREVYNFYENKESED